MHSLDVQRRGRRAHGDCRRPCGGATGVLVYFGDTAANAYALNAETGRVVWTRKVDDHPLARITGSPTLHAGRLYVPVSSYEESQGADPRYECCTFRGSVSALDAATGRVIWKTLMITDPLQRRGTSTAGVALWGPSGSAIWSAPTIDEGRQRLYVATGNAYSAPAHKSSDAVVALDLDTRRDSMDASAHPGRCVFEQLPRRQSRIVRRPTALTSTSAVRRCSPVPTAATSW